MEYAKKIEELIQNEVALRVKKQLLEVGVVVKCQYCDKRVDVYNIDTDGNVIVASILPSDFESVCDCKAAKTKRGE